MARTYAYEQEKKNSRSRSAVGNREQRIDAPEYSYLIDFSMDPIQFGFSRLQSNDQREFSGLHAFNKYFDTLVPDQGAFNLPDIWDGYYRVTLAQFRSYLDPRHLRQKLGSFSLTSIITEPPDALFKSCKFDLNKDHTYYLGKDFNEEPMALFVIPSLVLNIADLVDQLKKKIGGFEWKKTPVNSLHMNIHMFVEKPTSNGHTTWTWERACQLGMPRKVLEHPIAFYKSKLEIIPSRQNCINIYKQDPSFIWWDGITDHYDSCSDCHNTTLEKGEYHGYCFTCKIHESIKPVWSVPFSTKVDDPKQSKQVIEPNSLQFVKTMNPWKEDKCMKDILVIGLTTNIPSQISEALLENCCPDLFFVKRIAENENGTEHTPNTPHYKFLNVTQHIGLYYKSTKFDLLGLIDNSDIHAPMDKDSSTTSKVVDTGKNAQKYSVYLRRHTCTENKENQGEIKDYSFIVTAHDGSISSSQDSSATDSRLFFENSFQVQRKIRPTPNSLCPTLLVVHEDTGIPLRDDEHLPNWIGRSLKNPVSDASTIKNGFYYSNREANLKMVMGEMQHFDHLSKYNYHKQQWDKVRELLVRHKATASTNSEQLFAMTFLALKT